VKLTETRDPAALTALREEWDALVGRAEQATIYQTWEWNDAWWRAYARGKRLRLLLVHDGPDLIGLAPFYSSRHLGTPLRRLAFVGTGASDYLDVLAAPDAEPHVCAEVCKHLADSGDYDLADLQQLGAASPFAAHVSGHPVSGLNGHRVALRRIETCPYVDLPVSWDAFLNTLGKKMRSNVTYYERLAARDLADASMTLCAGADLPEAMEALFRLHQRRWRSRMLPGVLGSGSVRRFHRDVADRFSSRGWLRLHVTRVGGDIVAALYCYSFRNRYYYYLGGFEPALGKYSLGTVLTASAIRQAIAEGCEEFDFLRGHEAYKYRWKPRERENAQCLIARPPSWRSNAMLALNRLERYIERKAKAYSDGAARGKGTGR
jgi:CelD/BcsL family acetyltransferase involved in cellulose biosynthesis